MSPLKIAFLTTFIDLIGFGIIIPIQPFYAQSFGASATLITLGASNFLYFYFYNGFKLFVRLRSGLPTIGPLINLVVASAASSINVTLTNPLWISANAVRRTLPVSAPQTPRRSAALHRSVRHLHFPACVAYTLATGYR